MEDCSTWTAAYNSESWSQCNGREARKAKEAHNKAGEYFGVGVGGQGSETGELVEHVGTGEAKAGFVRPEASGVASTS